MNNLKGSIHRMYPRHATSSSHTWWGSVFGSLISRTSGDIWRFFDTDPHKAFGCLGMILYIYLSLKFVVFGSAQEESAQEEKDVREKLARCVNYRQLYFSSGAFGGGNMRKAKTTSGDLGCTGEASGEQDSINHHELHSTVTFVTVFCYRPCMVYLPTCLFEIYGEYNINIP